ncbi:MAG: acyl-CoA dehydrogenase family protein, partial [Candidatus Riflebacteria bacterium]|nr:acyl-CoA dehydrogenase family protein [Candidatus Riflebacteria bacterium]
IEQKATVEVDGQQVPVGIWLLKKAGELGLVGLDVPEEYGGLGHDKTTSARLAEACAGCASQAATVGAHAGIGTLPIVLFGSKEQKERYLPRLATGEIVSCYALTEPGSGSDALSGNTTAVPTDDGSAFILNGEKLYITNGGWADLAIVFARVGDDYSGFIVDLHTPGCSRGAEEKKMGIRGSSTTSLVFQDVRVPRENMLGAPGDAARIALNILYLGRMKLGFGCLGTSKQAIDLTIKFGKDRKQFGQPVISFDIQKAKLADMVTSVFALDSLAYRTVGAIDCESAKLDKADPKHDEKVIEVLRSFGVETSIVKVVGSETLVKVANHAIRMHGGYGFCEEYQVERIARDNVVDTIFEGTNDINRLVIFGTMVQNVFGGDLGFREYMEELHSEIREGKLQVTVGHGPLEREINRVVAAKRAVAFTVEQAIIGTGKDIRVEQQVIAAMADALMALYSGESTVARVHAMLAKSDRSRRGVLGAIAALAVHERCQDIRRLTLDTLAHVVPAGELPAKRATLSALLDETEAPVDSMSIKSLIADHAIEAGKYDL